MENGAALKLMLEEMRATATEAGLVEGLQAIASTLRDTANDIAQTTASCRAAWPMAAFGSAWPTRPCT